MPRRSIRHNRRQLICVLADNSGSMAEPRLSPKAAVATEAIQRMVEICKGAPYPPVSYFDFVLIRFGDDAIVGQEPSKIKDINPDSLVIDGRGGGTNIARALEVAHGGISRYLERVNAREDHAECPLPLVIMYSDGHNTGDDPKPSASRLKSLGIGADKVLVACLGIETEDSVSADEGLLRTIASPGCYATVKDMESFFEFLVRLGPSRSMTPQDLSKVMDTVATANRLRRLNGST